MNIGNGEKMIDEDELSSMPLEVRQEMRRRVIDARDGNVKSIAEARRRSKIAESERPDLFPVPPTIGFR